MDLELAERNLRGRSHGLCFCIPLHCISIVFFCKHALDGYSIIELKKSVFAFPPFPTSHFSMQKHTPREWLLKAPYTSSEIEERTVVTSFRTKSVDLPKPTFWKSLLRLVNAFKLPLVRDDYIMSRCTLRLRLL